MISLFLPFFLITEPFMIFIQKFLVPFFQFLYGDHLPEPFHHFCLQIGICHLDSNLRQAFLNTVNIAITHSLSLMNLHRLFHLFHISIYSFNLIDPDNFIFCKNSICTTFHLNDRILVFTFSFQGNFRLIIAFHASLDLPVKPASH